MSQVNKENWENKTEESKEEFKNILFDVNININHSYGGDKMNDENEIWKDVKGYEGLYKVSNKGRVYSFIKNYYSQISGIYICS